MEVVNCKEINFTYPNRQHKALQDISFTLNKGELCLVMGASAAGKSTLLQLLKQEIAPAGTFSGMLEINGDVGYVPQYAEEFIVCDKVRSELAFGLTNLGKSAAEIELLTAENASYFHLEDKLDDEIAALSGGEKQLVNLAAVMMMKPSVLVLDEPCAQLDPVSAERFIQVVLRLRRDFNTTVIISEHNTELFFDSVDCVLLLDDGRQLLFDDAERAVRWLQQTRHPMLGAVPLSRRLNSSAVSVKPEQKADEKTETALTAKNLWFAYDKGKDILQDCSINVYRGQINAVIGANGSGKTTLLKALAGVRKPYRGRIKKQGHLSMLTQNVHDLLTKDTCREEVSFGDMTDFLGISDIADCHPYDVSGGQAQRLALAKVLEQGADIILLDEPTQGFDCVLKEKLAQLLQMLCRDGKTILVVSHDIEFVGACADTVSFMSRGRIITTSKRREFFRALNFYTTALSRMTNGAAVALKDIENED